MGTYNSPAGEDKQSIVPQDIRQLSEEIALATLQAQRIYIELSSSDQIIPLGKALKSRVAVLLKNGRQIKNLSVSQGGKVVFLGWKTLQDSKEVGRILTTLGS